MSLIKNLAKLPVAVSGLALGIAGIGNLLAVEISGSLRYVCAALAALILLAVAVKKIVHPRLLWREIAHPVLGSFIPTFDMGLMLLANIVASFSLLIGQIVWCCAVILHVVFAVSFVYHRAKCFNLDHMLPSWFLPPVGIIVACVTGNIMNAPAVTHGIFYTGFVLYCIMLPVMMYRLIFGDRLKEEQLPSFAIIGAPASLCLVGYLDAFNHPDPVIVNFLLALSLMMTALVYISMARVNTFRIAFDPIYAAYTFPLAISAAAVMKYAFFAGVHTSAGQLWYVVGWIEMIIALVVIIWVLIRMIKVIVRTVIYGMD